eukprot:Seg3528.3 transcript_id=Seg3528.3/GoldUCD/mRNA.D3Y31 product="hypothetical protein" protein_id=Seg3528.3/GoldUCD/D3Y31
MTLSKSTKNKIRLTFGNNRVIVMAQETGSSDGVGKSDKVQDEILRRSAKKDILVRSASGQNTSYVSRRNEINIDDFKLIESASDKHRGKNLLQDATQNAKSNKNTSRLHLGFPAIVKSKSSSDFKSLEAQTSKNQRNLDRDKVMNSQRFMKAEISPMINRKFPTRGTPEKLKLPRVQQLRLGERRRSRSLQDLSVEQVTDLRREFSRQMSESFEDFSWSQDWQRARDGVVRRRNGLPSVEITDSYYDDFDKNDKNKLTRSRSVNLPQDLSLEERLARIEQIQGL